MARSRRSWTPRRVEWVQTLEGPLRDDPRDGVQPGWHAAGQRGAPDKDGAALGHRQPIGCHRGLQTGVRLRAQQFPTSVRDGRSLLAIGLRDERKRVELRDTATGRMRGQGDRARGAVDQPRLEQPTANGSTWRVVGETVRVVETASGQVTGTFQIDAQLRELRHRRRRPRREMVCLLRPGQNDPGPRPPCRRRVSDDPVARGCPTSPDVQPERHAPAQALRSIWETSSSGISRKPWA